MYTRMLLTLLAGLLASTTVQVYAGMSMLFHPMRMPNGGDMS